MGYGTSSALMFLIDTLFALYIIVLLVRVLLQFTHANFRNPLSQFVYQVTNPPLRPLSAVIPRWRHLDIPAVLLALLLCFINIQIDGLFYPQLNTAPVLAVALSAIKLLVMLCDLYTFSIIIQAILSWVAPGAHSPATAVLWSINEPILRPVRERMPMIGGLDISPLVVIIGLQVVSRLMPLHPLLR
ncbi:MAG: YggT family protein [Salinisphaeraceae bacterium]|nr:YggT family protein [Salinisphaeraceae bacterium]